MPDEHAVRDALHGATHRVAGVPQHRDFPEGHQGASHHGRSLQNRGAQNRVTRSRAGGHQGSTPAHDRPPRVLVRWQTWIADRVARKAE